jgi:uncharacterized protein (TIGR00369 family)
VALDQSVRGKAALEAAFSHFPMPSSAKLLGWSLIDGDLEAGWLKVGYSLDERFRNPTGMVQGGFVAAMIDDTMGPLLFLRVGATKFPSTTDLHSWYFKGAEPGSFVCEARIQRLGGTIAFVEGDLWDGFGDLVAKAQSTVRLVPFVKET